MAPCAVSGAVINLGHSDPQSKLRGHGLTTWKCATREQPWTFSLALQTCLRSNPANTAEATLSQDLVAGKEVEFRATAYGTDCYPRTAVKTTLTKDDLNQFYLLNFRNGYQRYNCAVNSSDEVIYTYMSKLLPRFKNATFSGAGELNPLMNDPRLRNHRNGHPHLPRRSARLRHRRRHPAQPQKPQRHPHGQRRRERKCHPNFCKAAASPNTALPCTLA